METAHVGYVGAAKFTGINRGTLYALVSRKQIPHVRIGGRHVLFSIEELKSWINRHRVDVTNSATKGEKAHG